VLALSLTILFGHIWLLMNDAEYGNRVSSAWDEMMIAIDCVDSKE
jgi:hypothetical protein